MEERRFKKGTGLTYIGIEGYDLEYLNIHRSKASWILWKETFSQDCIGFKIKHLGYILFYLIIDLHVP